MLYLNKYDRKKHGIFFNIFAAIGETKLFMLMPLFIKFQIFHLLTQLGSPMAHQMPIYCSPASIVRFYC